VYRGPAFTPADDLMSVLCTPRWTAIAWTHDEVVYESLLISWWVGRDTRQ